MLRWIGILCLVTLLAACERPRSQGRYSVTTTTTRPVDSGEQSAVPATLPTSRPVASTLQIGEKIVTFPRARLLVQDTQPEVVLLLFSDDPRDALDPNYTGNRYYLQIKLDIDDLANLPAADWHFKAASIERADSPNGIFLEGDRQQLQPYDVTIVFNRVGGQIGITLSGQFLAFVNRPAEVSAPRAVFVQGALLTELETPRKLR